MTKLPYPFGWTAELQVRRNAPDSGYAWNVNFNSGNSNGNNRNNNGFVRAVRGGECQDAVSLRDLHIAWREARRGKEPSNQQVRFELDWVGNLIDLQNELNAGSWQPAKPTCFIAKAPKAREIHAPDFRDRVVHHWLATRLLNRLHGEFTWLRAALLRRRFDYRAEGRSITIKRGRAL